ncbi:MAG TPA: hypothetical protein VGJ84_12635 [Polyangiaceae bacterium]|jgi:hypothetical protein
MDEPRYGGRVSFRRRLLDTLRAMEPVLEEPGVLVVGSQVPNLLEPGAAATLVVSQDVDFAIPVSCHSPIKTALRKVRGLQPSRDEPSVWVPDDRDLLEVNFIGVDPDLNDAADARVLQDPELPLLVFGALSLIFPGEPLEVEGLKIPLPRPAGLVLEKLVTDRSGEKGNRDLLVALALLPNMTDSGFEELLVAYAKLRPELRYVVRSNLTILSLMGPSLGMPDPRPERGRVAALLRRFEACEKEAL